MKFTFSVHCETLAELKDAIQRLEGAACKTSIEMPPKQKDLGDAPVNTDVHDRSPTLDLQEPRKNISPGEPAISKIGSQTKAAILEALAMGIPQPSVKYVEHLKLLWKRGEINYDGKEYYLPCTTE